MSTTAWAEEGAATSSAQDSKSNKHGTAGVNTGSPQPPRPATRSGEELMELLMRMPTKPHPPAAKRSKAPRAVSHYGRASQKQPTHEVFLRPQSQPSAQGLRPSTAPYSRPIPGVVTPQPHAQHGERVAFTGHNGHEIQRQHEPGSPYRSTSHLSHSRTQHGHKHQKQRTTPQPGASPSQPPPPPAPAATAAAAPSPTAAAMGADGGLEDLFQGLSRMDAIRGAEDDSMRSLVPICETIAAISWETSLQKVNCRIDDACQALLKGDKCRIFMLDAVKDTLTLVHGEPVPDGPIVSAKKGIIGRVAYTAEVVCVAEGRSHPYYDPAVDGGPHDGERAILCAPAIYPIATPGPGGKGTKSKDGGAGGGGGVGGYKGGRGDNTGHKVVGVIVVYGKLGASNIAGGGGDGGSAKGSKSSQHSGFSPKGASGIRIPTSLAVSSGKTKFNAGEELLAALIAKQAGVALLRCGAFDTMRATRWKASLLVRATRRLAAASNTLDVGSIAVMTTQYAKQLTDAGRATVYMVDHRSHNMYSWELEEQPPLSTKSGSTSTGKSGKGEGDANPAAAAGGGGGGGGEKLNETKRPLGPIIEDVVRTGRCLNIASTHRDPRLAALVGTGSGAAAHYGDAASALWVPIRAPPPEGGGKGAVVCVIECLDRKGGTKFQGSSGVFEKNDEELILELGSTFCANVTHAFEGHRRRELLKCMPSLTASTAVPEALGHAAISACHALGCDWAAVFEVAATGEFVYTNPDGGGGMARDGRATGPLGRVATSDTRPSFTPHTRISGVRQIKPMKLHPSTLDARLFKHSQVRFESFTYPMANAVKSNRTFIIADTKEDRNLPAVLQSMQVPEDALRADNMLVAPCSDASGRVNAVVLAGNKRAGGWARALDTAFDSTDVKLLDELASQVGASVANITRSHKEAYFATQWTKLVSCNLDLLKTRDIRDLMTLVRNSAAGVTGCESVVLFMHNVSNRTLWTLTSSGKEGCVSRRDCVEWRVFDSKETIHARNASGNDNHPDYLPGLHRTADGGAWRSICCVPVIDKQGVCIGVLQAINKLDRTDDVDDNSKSPAHGGSGNGGGGGGRKIVSHDGFDNDDVQSLQHVAGFIGIGVDHMGSITRRFEIEDELRGLVDSFLCAGDAGNRLTSVAYERDLFKELKKCVASLLGATQLTVYLYDQDDDEEEEEEEEVRQIENGPNGKAVTVIRMTNFRSDKLERSRSTCRGLCATVLQGQSMNIADVQQCQYFDSTIDQKSNAFMVHTALISPVRDIDGNIIASILVGNKSSVVAEENGPDLTGNTTWIPREGPAVTIPGDVNEAATGKVEPPSPGGRSPAAEGRTPSGGLSVRHSLIEGENEAEDQSAEDALVSGGGSRPVTSGTTVFAQFTDRDLQILERLATNLGVALNNVQRHTRFDALSSQILSVSSELSLVGAMDKIGATIADVCGARWGGLFVIEPELGHLWAYDVDVHDGLTTLSSGQGPSANMQRLRLVCPVGQGLVGIAAETNKIVNVQDIAVDPRLDGFGDDLLDANNDDIEGGGRGVGLGGDDSGDADTQADLLSGGVSTSASKKAAQTLMWERERYVKQVLESNSAVAVPVRDKTGRCFAVMEVRDRGDGDAFDAEDIAILNIFARHAALVMGHATMFHHSVNESARLRALVSSLDGLLSNRDESALAVYALSVVQELLPQAAATLFITDRTNPRLATRYEGTDGQGKKGLITGIASHVIKSSDVVNTSEKTTEIDEFGNLGRHVQAEQKINATVMVDSNDVGAAGGGGGGGETQDYVANDYDLMGNRIVPFTDGDAPDTAVAQNILCVPITDNHSGVALGALQINDRPKTHRVGSGSSTTPGGVGAADSGGHIWSPEEEEAAKIVCVAIGFALKVSYSHADCAAAAAELKAKENLRSPLPRGTRGSDSARGTPQAGHL